MFSYLCIVPFKIVYEIFDFLESLFLYLNLIHFGKKVEGENPKKNSQKLKTVKEFLPFFLLGRISQRYQAKTVILQKSLSRCTLYVPVH